jgi:proteasome accessory factor B
MALLATKRFLTKNQIFESVDGYEGSPETKERMFERDKTELRALGLEIEVGNEDPLFDDEAGYRISPQNYSLELDGLSTEDISLLSLATSQWQNSLFSKSAQSALRKVEALHGAFEQESLSLPFHHMEIPDDRFGEIWQATQESRELSFDYRGVTQTRRSVAPYTLYLLEGRWYLVAFDLEKSEFRQFKISRMNSENFTVGKKFNRSSDFDLETFLNSNDRDVERVSLEIAVRKGRAQELRASYPTAEYDADWDLMKIQSVPQNEIFESIARSGDSAKILAPLDIQEKFSSWIRGKRYG